MTADQFVSKWEPVTLPERSASQEHFLDLCRLIGQPTPAAADPTGENDCFEKSVKVVAAASKGSKGDRGFVDVWKRGCSGWEYKRKDKYKSLDEAYRQLYQYRDALDNPPLSILCDCIGYLPRSKIHGVGDPRLMNRMRTKLYHERPTWLRSAHEQLDRAVLAAYAATDPAGGWNEDWAAVWVERGRAAVASRKQDDFRAAASRENVFRNLFRLNKVRLECLRYLITG